MAPSPLPSFSKILLDPSAPHLPLPHAFVRKHLGNTIPENLMLRSVNGGYSWRLKIKKLGGVYCFVDGWNDVVEDSQLEFGDFLVFWLVDPSTFKLSIYSPSGCKKDFPFENDDFSEEEEEEEDNEEEEDDGKDVDEEEEEEDEDEYDDGGGGGGGCDEEEEEDDGGDEDDDGGGDFDGDDGDPFFRTIISIGHSRSMRLPTEFTRLAGIDSARSVTTKNMEGKEWKMNLLSDSKYYECKKSENKHDAGRNYARYFLSKGWCEFKRVNDLCEGDECVFTFIRSEDKLCLAKVTKKRVPAKPPAGKAPVAEVSKRSGGRPTRVEVESEDDGREAVEKKVRSKQAGGKAPVTEVLKRPRGRPPREEVVEKRGRGKKPAGKAPTAQVLKGKRWRPSGVEVESKDGGAEAVKRSRGRPFKRKRGRPTAHVK